MEDIKISYASANIPFPAKILHHEKLIKSCKKKKYIPPIHIQLNPTNRCNFNCPFCSCSARDKKLELTYDEIIKTMKIGKKLGCESVTITGGGEPLMHQDINEIIDKIHKLGIEIGLVVNGTLLDRLKTKTLNRITWCRISSSDYLGNELKKIGMNFEIWFDKIIESVETGRKVDWAFSHVVGEKPNYKLIGAIVNVANIFNFTHVRLVNDIFIADKLTKQMNRIRNYLKKKKIDDSIVNYQDRSEWTRGTKYCYISLLKPVLGADGYWYPCCGTQYALANPARDYEKLMRMTEKRLDEGLKDIIENQKYFDGSICVKCYYHPYNQVLKIMLSEIKHEKFV